MHCDSFPLHLGSKHDNHNLAHFSVSVMGRSKQAPLRLLWKGRAWAVQGPRSEPAREHQENTQGVEDGEEENLEGLEVEERRMMAVLLRSADAHQGQCAPTPAAHASGQWVVSAAMTAAQKLCNPCSGAYWASGRMQVAEGTLEMRTMLSDALCLLCCTCTRIAEQLLCCTEDHAG